MEPGNSDCQVAGLGSTAGLVDALSRGLLLLVIGPRLRNPELAGADAAGGTRGPMGETSGASSAPAAIAPAFVKVSVGAAGVCVADSCCVPLLAASSWQFGP